MIYIVVIPIILYLIAMLVVILVMMRLARFHSENTKPQTKFSIIIPFRNEAERISLLLDSIQRLDYPFQLYEIIFVDDSSEDASVAIILKAFDDRDINLRPSFRVISNKRRSASPKKDAITEAISISENDWIITTDADCVLPSKWLSTFDSYIKKHEAVLVAGPVTYHANNSLVEQFQKLDGFSLQAVTMAGFGLKKPILCNGANLAYKKEVFLKVEGFSENNHIASGDDIFILEKINTNYPGRVQFLKSEEAIVTTFPEKEWPSVVEQRIRWASKTSKQNNIISKCLGLLVFLANLMVVIGPIYCLWDTILFSVYLPIFLLKILLDFTVLKISSRFFQSKIKFPSFLGSILLYPFVIVWVVLGSLKGNYNWKGRKFEKQG